ncbi:FUSC family protein [Gordonia sp. NB41Y]|uniref:FUSC family protein n=1 Tax=Gordonia sp. NB41Y TaxID=875808 RepID=UPI00128EAA90|nr:FUSC family protein [Gordonia sp. NB41Y]WLP88560.1 FUSC family protein [Gordonia sp. NB41Y]
MPSAPGMIPVSASPDPAPTVTPRLGLAFWRTVVAADPGHTRLVNATAVASAVLIAVVVAAITLTALHQPLDLLVMAGILTMMGTAQAKDATPRARVVTAAILPFPAMVGATLAVTLSGHRPAQIAAFIVVAGVATWLRRFGIRGAGAGMVAFYGYFFPLLLKVPLHELPLVLLVIAISLGSGLVVRLVLLRQRPRRQIVLLLDEFRAAVATAVDTALTAPTDPHGEHQVQTLMSRLSAVALAISGWRRRFATHDILGIDDADLSRAVFDAQVAVEQAIPVVWDLRRRGGDPADLPAVTAAIGRLRRELDGTTTSGSGTPATRAPAVGVPAVGVPAAEALAAVDLSVSVLGAPAVDSAASEPAASEPAASDSAASEPAASAPAASDAPAARTAPASSTRTATGPGTARAAIGSLTVIVLDATTDAMTRLRALESPRPTADPAPTAPVSTASRPTASASVASGPTAAGPTTPVPEPRRSWFARLRATRPPHLSDVAPTTRMAVQVMAATGLATIAGECISASRWYWAVLTAFVVFVGTTSRAGILTRAYNRVLGTAGGIAVGGGVMLAVNHHVTIELILCVVCVFLAFYFGPLHYWALVGLITVMLASLYDLLGILDLRLLEERIEETLVGAVIGVVCAYLLFSANSRSVLTGKVDAYLAALGDLVTTATDHMAAPSDAGTESSSATADLTAASHALDVATAGVDSAVGAMSLAFAAGPTSTIAHRDLLVMTQTTRCAHQLAESVIALCTSDSGDSSDADGPFTGDDAAALRHAVDRIRSDINAISPALHDVRHVDGDVRRVPDTVVVRLVTELDLQPGTRRTAAILALSRLRCALLQLPGVDSDTGHRD